MIKAVARPRQWQQWICTACRSQRSRRAWPARQYQHRRLITTSRPAASELELETDPDSELGSPSREAPLLREDDFILRSVFDYPHIWKEFSHVSGGVNVGLFRNPYLKHPRGFLTFARVSLKKARAVVDRVLAASSVAEYRAIVRELDRLSDILCRVLDMADFVRVTHPSRLTQRMASEAWDMVYQYMNELNTMTGLHDQLAVAMANPDVTAAWSEEEKAVAEVLKLDFTKSAVNLPQKYRDRFVELSSEISTVGSAFVQEMAPDQPALVLPSGDFFGMDPLQARDLTRGGKVHLPTLSGQAALALRTVHSAETRKLIYYASRTASRRSVEMLEHLMKLRAELAALSGFESYSHLVLRDRMMARTPEAVDQFLRALAASNRPQARREMAELLAEKQKVNPLAASLDPWDKDYYSEAIRQRLKQSGRPSDHLSSYFSLGVVMQGLSRLFTELYGIRFVPKQPLVGETWHPDVRRLDVISDTDGHVAVLYCDLFYRPDKSPNPAHFTLRCSREISEAEMAEVWEQSQNDPEMIRFARPEIAANDGMAFSEQGGSVRQLPTIVLICDFPQSSTSSADQPALLSFFQLETLFHEMGHAIHSILARTSFQTVAGTRCATDLAELPSTLMEYFAADAAVLGQFARHYETNEPLPYRLVAHQVRLARRFEASDAENQIILAMLDQALHSPAARRPDFDSTAIFHGLQRVFGSGPPDPPGTRWHGFFGHLSGYGGAYYSYLFDRVLAQRVWDVVFSSGVRRGALNRRNGERLKESLLKWGGGRDPWKCLAEVLQDGRLADGGEKAMALVGSWGSTRP
ncbi:uncharacterized protein THITE_2113856 [Thermothielavioides terrestris NRRL 8126]|uniref:Mitochondrial intermediate peptidase n=1 Tax=Thermothielavioides terrestris (strain ATCC 38088 / NRRL 8126) TaxID=578455 RepID=G2R4B4_THETT|nr:uncharacterized protein THITE_2113856 [Thermothielavioides terrestris NRRL 8126]AEO66061.1 hypothetical protein THITE_2113856 [Thermothielavioides terrestris NRRL 8126]